MPSNTELMMQQIRAQADLFENCSHALYDQCLTFLKENDGANRIQKIYLTGCGDSYFAGMNTLLYFAKATRVPTFAYQALELSRYILPYEVDEKSLVVSISASGSVARTAECAIRAHQAGALSMAVTTNPASRLAKVAPQVLCVELPKNLGLAPGTQSYCASLLCLYSLASALGYLKGQLTAKDVDHYFETLQIVIDALRVSVEPLCQRIDKYLAVYLKEDHPFRPDFYHLLASGPNAGTAQFGVMKLLEAAGFDGLAQGIEEWAHSQYFTTRPSTHTLILAPRGESHERALEILKAIHVKDGKALVVGEENDAELAALADIYLPICGIDQLDEAFSPLVYLLPVEILAMTLAVRLQRNGFDFENQPWVKEENFRQIFHSTIRDLKGERYER